MRDTSHSVSETHSGSTDPGPVSKLSLLILASDRSRIVWLFLSVVLMAVLQVAGVASVLPFLELAVDPDALSEGRLAWAFDALNIETARQALVATGLAVLVLLTLSNAASAWLIWQRQRIAWSVAHHLSMRLVNGYVALPYSFFLVNSSADLIRKNVEDVNGVVNGVLLAGSSLLTNIIVSLLIAALLAVIAPVATFIAGGALFALFGAVAVIRRKYLSELGHRRIGINRRRFETFVDLVGGIKTVKTDAAESFFVDRFARASREFANLNPTVQFAAAAPRFAFEVLVLGGVVLITIGIEVTDRSLNDALPTLTLFVVAAYKLIPALSGAYSNYVSAVSSFPAIDNIYEDLRHIPADGQAPHVRLKFVDRIDVDGVTFRYDDVNEAVLHDITLTVEKGEKVAFVGPTGSGKSTLIDILMGLFPPDAGEVRIDGARLDETNKNDWRARVAYVPQAVFLYDATLEQNVAFGQPSADPERLARACEWAQLTPLLKRLPQGAASMLGERGVRLSGGERQRIGLARAFYRMPEVLVLDEATSALDNRTEAAVIDAIERNLSNTTILMIAHRISTVRKCDRLYVMDRGRILAKGSFDELVVSSTLFQDLARIS